MEETVEKKLAEAYKNITEAHMLRTIEGKLAETYKIITEKHRLKLDVLNLKLSILKEYDKDEDLACRKEQKGE